MYLLTRLHIFFFCEKYWNLRQLNSSFPQLGMIGNDLRDAFKHSCRHRGSSAPSVGEESGINLSHHVAIDITIHVIEVKAILNYLCSPKAKCHFHVVLWSVSKSSSLNIDFYDHRIMTLFRWKGTSEGQPLQRSVKARLTLNSDWISQGLFSVKTWKSLRVEIHSLLHVPRNGFWEFLHHDFPSNKSETGQPVDPWIESWNTLGWKGPLKFS